MAETLRASAPPEPSGGARSCLALLRRFGRNPFSTCLLYDRVRRHPLACTDGFVGYLESARILVAIGEPVCTPADWPHAIDEFAAAARERDKNVAWVAVSERFLQASRPSEPTWLYLGEDFIYDVATYAPRGDAAKKVRSARNQLWRHGGRAREVRPDALTRDPVLARQLPDVVGSWLHDKSRLQMRLLDLDLFQLSGLKRYFVVECDGRLLGVLSCLPIFARRGYLLEDLVRHPDAPTGTTELLVLAAIEALRADGCEMATFGLSPRVDAGRSNLAGPSRAVTAFGVRLANRFGHLDRLYHYRKKYHTGCSEPSFLVKQPRGISVGDVWGVLRAFNLP